MKLVSSLVLLATTAVASPVPAQAQQALFPFCKAERTYVLYEAAEGFVLYGAAEHHNAIRSTITCSIRRFGATVASASQTAPGPASAVVEAVETPYGGLELCTYAEHLNLLGRVTYGPYCSRIPAP